MASYVAQITRFADAARSYCAFLESRPEGDEPARARETRNRLAEVIAAATALPELEALDERRGDELLQSPAIGWDDVVVVRPMLFYPANDGTTRGQLLKDDLCDVHRDLRDGLKSFDAGHRALAAWTWKFTFETHWGQHATCGLGALHALCAD